MQSVWNITIDPQVPISVIWAAAIAALTLITFSAIKGTRGYGFRALAYFTFLVVLIDPTIRKDNREPVPDVVILAVDQSESQSLSDRTEQTEGAISELKAQLEALDNLEIKEISVRDRVSGPAAAPGGSIGGNTGGTNLIRAITDSLADVAPERVAGVIAVTDGQIHDGDNSPPGLMHDAPFHAILSGHKSDRDRRLKILNAPKFTIVGQEISVQVHIEDQGIEKERDASFKIVQTTISINGEFHETRMLTTGEDHTISISLAHRGESIVEIDVEDLPGELTKINNRAALSINGIRDRLRVLLVSGEPHAGERTWRNLLKADPSVDLVHFTILRPPEKQDGTPANELSLIAFPTRQLFAQKLNEFDLIIFDRYRRRGVLPIAYLANVARYVEEGGALLSAAGPAFASPFSLYRTPLAEVLPARPTGSVIEKAYRPTVSALGFKHPVTYQLPGANSIDLADAANDTDPDWGRWFRLMDSEQVSGNTLMVGPDEAPLLILDHYGEGRIAQLLSDQAWLWTRGYDGGGPQAELLRRLAHWLMREPDLEEERLTIVNQNGSAKVTRRSMAQSVPPLTSRSPSGLEIPVTLTETAPGEWTGAFEPTEVGLYKLTDGELTTLTAVGPLNPLEFAAVRATEEKISRVVKESGGGLFWIEDGGIPKVQNTKPGRRMYGTNRIGLKRNNQFIIKGVSEVKLIPAFAALLILLGSLVAMWRREAL